MSFVKEIVAIEEEQLQLMSIDVIVEHIGSHLSRPLLHHRTTPERRLELIYWIITNWRLSSISQNAIRWMCKRPDHNMIIGHNYIIIIICQAETSGHGGVVLVLHETHFILSFAASQTILCVPRLIVTFVSYNIINSTANGLQSCFGAVLLVRWDWSPLCRAFHQDDDLLVTIECLCWRISGIILFLGNMWNLLRNQFNIISWSFFLHHHPLLMGISSIPPPFRRFKEIEWQSLLW